METILGSDNDTQEFQDNLKKLTYAQAFLVAPICGLAIAYNAQQHYLRRKSLKVGKASEQTQLDLDLGEPVLPTISQP